MRIIFFQKLHKSKSMCSVYAFLTVICISLPISSLADEIDLTGTWGGWGTVILKKNGENYYKGTYTDTYHRERGNITLTLRKLRGSGSWSEDEGRGGKLFNVKVSQDGQTITGKWNTTKFEYGGFVKESSFTWSIRPGEKNGKEISPIIDCEQPKIAFLQIEGTGLTPVGPEGVRYGAVFVVEARCASPQEGRSRELTLDWGGDPLVLDMARQGDGRVFRSEKLYLMPPKEKGR